MEELIHNPNSRFKETSRSLEILEEASRLFYENGYGHVGMRLIADAVGVRAATLYHHFNGKDDMLFQIALGVTQTFIERILPTLEETDGSRAERLKAFIRQHIIFRWQRRYWISTTLRDLKALPIKQQDEVIGYLRHYQDILRNFIQAGIDEGTFHTQNGTLAGLALIGMIHGINDWFNPSGNLTIEAVADMYADMAVDNLLRAAN
ncbi:TetR/AcrR family transcriptional regulator [Candidatus Leptofilum sp.]|uniref:TetR/AcrR family transcriptional regulator n=1 Tax=Candidatus Leptofilum sp. TaxID=3241576 RepID=UPI003B58D1AC